MIIEIFAVCLLAKFNRYKLRYLFRTWTFYPVFLMQLILLALQLSVFFGIYDFVRFSAFFERAVVLSFLFAIFAFRLYKPAIWGSGCVVLGTALNKFVMAQNGGKMPVFPSLSYLTGYTDPQALAGGVSGIHTLGGAQTNFKFLADIIDIGYSVLSLGDVLIHLFTCIMLYALIRATNLRQTLTEEKYVRN